MPQSPILIIIALHPDFARHHLDEGEVVGLFAKDEKAGRANMVFQGVHEVYIYVYMF